MKYLKILIYVISLGQLLHTWWKKQAIKREVLTEIKNEQKSLAKAQIEQAKKIDSQPTSDSKHDILDGF